MTTPVPGWYPDPQSPTMLRWWDGVRWTEHAQPLPGAMPPAAVYPQPLTQQTQLQAQTQRQAQAPQQAHGLAPAQPVQSGSPTEAPVSKPFFRRPWVWITGGVVVLVGVIAAVAGIAGSGEDDRTPPVTAATQASRDEDAVERITVPDVTGMGLDEATAALSAVGLGVGTIGDTGEVESQAPSGGIEVRPGTEVMLTLVDHAAEEAAAAAAEAAEGTVSQQNAYRSAQSYLEFMPFSRAGLIDQLTSEYGDGYPAEDAEFAVARLEAEGGVDWNAEAAEAAQSYLEFGSFSRQGLIDQLTSEYGEGFTPEQAEYGVSTTGL